MIEILLGGIAGAALAALDEYNPWPNEFDTNKISPEEEEAFLKCLKAEREARKEAT